MKLRSISLQLFRQHVSSQVHFPDGLVGVLGSNGSGKTTLVEAIGFALYGSPALRGNMEDVRTRTAPAKVGRGSGAGKRDQELRVELTLEHEGVIFRVVRTLKDAWLYVGGEAAPAATGTREVSARIAAIVGMSFKEFVATYCTEQKGLEFLSGEKGATDRERFIVRIMGYDRLEEVQELLRSDRKEKKGVLQGSEGSLGTREGLEQQLEREKQELQGAREKHDAASEAVQKADDEFSVLRERMTKLDGVRSQYLKEKEAFNKFQVRYEEREKQRTSRDQELAVKRALWARQVQPLVGERGVDEVISDVRKELACERAALEQAHDRKRRLEHTVTERRSRAAALREGVQQQVKQLQARAAKVGKLEPGSECPTCGQELGGSFEQVKSHFAAEEQRLKEQLAAAEREVLEARQEPLELAAAVAECTAIQARVSHAEARVSELESCQKLQQEVAELEVKRASVDGELQQARDDAERAQLRMTELRFSEPEYLGEKGGFDAAQAALGVLRLQRVKVEGEVKEKAAMVNRTSEELGRFDERRAEVERLRREVRLFDEGDRVLSDFRRFVNGSIRPRMAELASEYLADLTDGRYAAVDLGEDFTPTVIEDGEPKRVISGGEEDILNLCMRLALSHMLAERAGQHFSMLMLDEVFGSLDEGRRMNVLALLEKLRGRFEQIIIISHLDDIKDGVQHQILVEYDEETGSAVVKTPQPEDGEGLAVYNL